MSAQEIVIRNMDAEWFRKAYHTDALFHAAVHQIVHTREASDDDVIRTLLNALVEAGKNLEQTRNAWIHTQMEPIHFPYPNEMGRPEDLR